MVQVFLLFLYIVLWHRYDHLSNIGDLHIDEKYQQDPQCHNVDFLLFYKNLSD
jgi:hypothetical protein